MTAVCPACRSPVSVSAYVCPRCGLAIRPSCQRCAEPLMVGMGSCGRCGEPVDPSDAPAISRVPQVPEVTVPIPAVGAPHTTAAPEFRHAPAVTEPIPFVPMPATRVAYPLLPVESAAPPVAQAWDEGRPRRGVLRWITIVAVSGLLVTAGLLALAMFGPNATRPAPEDIELVERIFSELGIALSLPADWEVEETPARLEAADRRQVGGQSVQGVLVRLDDRSPPIMDRRGLEEVNRGRVADYVAVRTDTDTTVDSSAAVHHAFLGDGLRYEQWWVAHEDGSLWIEFWSRQVDDNAFVLHRRILESLERL